MKKPQLLAYGIIIGSMVLAWRGPNDLTTIVTHLAVVVMTVFLTKEAK